MNVTPTCAAQNDIRLTSERLTGDPSNRRFAPGNSTGPDLRGKAPMDASPGRTRAPDMGARRTRADASGIACPIGRRDVLRVPAHVATPRATGWNIQAIQPIPFPPAPASAKGIAFFLPGAAFVVANIRVVTAGAAFLRLGAAFLMSGAGFVISGAEFVVASLGVIGPRIGVGESPDIVMISLDSGGISSHFVAFVHGVVMLGCVAAARAPGLCGLVCVRPSLVLNHHTMLYHAISQA